MKNDQSRTALAKLDEVRKDAQKVKQLQETLQKQQEDQYNKDIS
jgi:hypothetical protein